MVNSHPAAKKKRAAGTAANIRSCKKIEGIMNVIRPLLKKYADSPRAVTESVIAPPQTGAVGASRNKFISLYWKEIINIASVQSIMRFRE